MEYSYPATIQPDGDGFMVEFDGLVGATWGPTREAALREAQDLLVSSLSFFVDDGKPTPVPGEANGRPMVSIPAADAAKLALHDAMVAGGISNVELARRLGVSETVARRLRDPLHASRMDKIEAALRAVGRRLVVQIEEAA